jgi:hypothetical protein
MVTETEIIQTITQMPESLKQELFHYANYLINNYSAPIAEQPPLQNDKPRKRRSGILQGTFVLPLAEDFDEPLDEFKEYME